MRLRFCLSYLAFALCCVITCAHSHYAHAEQPSPPVSAPPVPESKNNVLNSLDDEIKTVKSKQSALDNKANTLEKDLKNLKKDLVATASKVQKHEKDLRETETQIKKLNDQKKSLQAQFETDREQMSHLIMAMARIHRMPVEALIAKPDAPHETAQAATLLSAILPALNKRAEELKDKLQSLQKIETKLVESQQQLSETAKNLKDAEKNVKELLALRQKTFQETRQQIEDQEKVVSQISKQASDFRDLINKIEAKNKTLRELADKAHVKETPKSNDSGQVSDIANSRQKKNDYATKLAMADLPALGSAQLPLSGPIRVHYGQRDDIGAVCEGLRIEGRSGALIVSPMGGIVRYAGEFKKYGKIVLIEHKKNYHSLIAGLGKIDTFVGQTVDSGEPVGKLGGSSGNAPVLYYELRHNGQPINPSKKFDNIEG